MTGGATRDGDRKAKEKKEKYQDFFREGSFPAKSIA